MKDFWFIFAITLWGSIALLFFFAWVEHHKTIARKLGLTLFYALIWITSSAVIAGIITLLISAF